MQLTMDFDAVNWTRNTLHLETTDVHNHLEKNVRVSTVPGRMHQFHFGQIIYRLSYFALNYFFFYLVFVFILCSVFCHSFTFCFVLYCFASSHNFVQIFDDLTQQKHIHNHRKNK